MTTAGICLPCLRPIVDIRPSGQGTVSNCKGLFHWQLIELNVHADLIDGFHSDVIKLLSQNSEVLRILI